MNIFAVSIININMAIFNKELKTCGSVLIISTVIVPCV